MKNYRRVYSSVMADHLAKYRQMIFLSGPRQVGKTTLAMESAEAYVSWDKEKDRQSILSGADALAEKFGLASLRAGGLPIVAFDEIHRYSRWKTFLKGFFDTYEKNCRIIATGSARMDVYKRGGDSMMGRYFPYRIHPFSVGELLSPEIPDEKAVRAPVLLADDDWDALVRFGGFPEPLANRDVRFQKKWHRLRMEQLLREDIRDLTRTTELDIVERLAMILANRSGEQLVYASLAREVNVSEPTVKQWVTTLKALYYGFGIRPWAKNVENSLRKTEKWYLRDWSGIDDEGKRNETIVACHLLKAVELWTDIGIGDFELFYIRDKQKHEVDFLVAKDHKPWFLVESKTGDTSISPILSRMQKAVGAKHAFQVVANLPFAECDAFAYTDPVIVPARTFLAQLP